jgi:mannose-6-phosphate isomerase-like protein (cupin superfamily)
MFIGQYEGKSKHSLKMDIQKYIESGILEEYCLGLLGEEDQAFLIQMTMLYPEIKEELNAVELTMEKLASTSSVKPAPANKEKILARLGFETPGAWTDFTRLPAIDKNADQQAWLAALKQLIPGKPSEDFICEVIRKDDELQQMLVIAKTDVPEEEHAEYVESFFILKGRCECTVGNSRFKLGAGDFLEIPLNVKHNIKILSPVVAILQYRFLQ